MIQLRNFTYTDSQVFHRPAFSLLLPSGWQFSGGLIWRQHPTMPAAANVALASSDGLDEIRIFPSYPYTFSTHPMTAFNFREGSNYMGNEVRRPPQNYLDYLANHFLPQYRPGARIVSYQPSPELRQAYIRENSVDGGWGPHMQADAGIIRIEYAERGRIFEENLSCALLFVKVSPHQIIWVADKIIGGRTLKGRLHEKEQLFWTILKSFKLDLQWFNMYSQLVQAMIRGKMQELRNIGQISRMIHNNSNQISDMTMRAYEARQEAYDNIYRQVSESIRDVNSFHDPYKGYDVEFSTDYEYVYANALGDYILTDNPNYNPNIESNLEWTLLDQVQ